MARAQSLPVGAGKARPLGRRPQPPKLGSAREHAAEPIARVHRGARIRPSTCPACEEAVLPGFSEQLYPELLRRAGAELEAGRTVVLDATFRSRRLRTAARELALDHGAAFRFVECRVDPAVCRERLRRREQEGGERGWVEMFEHFLALWEPVKELVAEEHRVVDTRGPLAQSLRSLELGV